MSRYKFDEDEPYVVIERPSAGITPFLLGLALGAGAALLLAPRSGAATRRDIRRRAMNVRRTAEHVVTGATDTVLDTYQDARRRVEEQIDSARLAVDLKKRQVHRAMEAGRVAAHEAREELEQRIAETKAGYETGAAGARDARTTTVADDLDES